MTTYTTIPDSDVDPESPVTTSLITALRDNPIAITEGSAGAPSIAEAALATAVQNQLVTNGDTHDHSGGDGAVIGANGVVSSSIDKGFTPGSQSVPSATPWVIPSGTYHMSLFSANLTLEINVSSVWRPIATGSLSGNGGYVMSDGTNMRVVSSSGTQTVYYQQFD